MKGDSESCILYLVDKLLRSLAWNYMKSQYSLVWNIFNSESRIELTFNVIWRFD